MDLGTLDHHLLISDSFQPWNFTSDWNLHTICLLIVLHLFYMLYLILGPGSGSIGQLQLEDLR